MEQDRQTDAVHSFTIPFGQPLFGVLTEEDGRPVVRYFSGESDPAAMPGSEATLQAALAVIGAWSDLDWDDFADELDRIRHERPSTPTAE